MILLPDAIRVQHETIKGKERASSLKPKAVLDIVNQERKLNMRTVNELWEPFKDPLLLCPCTA